MKSTPSQECQSLRPAPDIFSYRLNWVAVKEVSLSYHTNRFIYIYRVIVNNRVSPI